MQPVFDALKPEGELRLRPRRQGRRRPLLQDGPQRHRVRPDAGLRRGLRAAGGADWSTTSPRSSAPGARARSSAPGCSTCWSPPWTRTPSLAQIAATPRTPARAAGRSRRDRQRRADAGDHRGALRPVPVAAGRVAGDEGGRGDAQPVRRPRGQAPAVGRARRTSRVPSHPGSGRPEPPVHVAHLSLVDFRSYAHGRGRRSSRASRRSSGRTARARPTWSRRSTTSRPGLAPGRDRRAAGAARARQRAIVRAAVVQRTTAQALVELEINPGRANRARLNRAPCPGPRGARDPAHGAVRARGPGAGQGRPGRAAAVPRRPARRPRAAVRRRPGGLRAGAASSATPCSRPPAARRRRGGRRACACARWTSGTPTWPAPAPSCWPAGWTWSPTLRPLGRPRPTPTSAAGPAEPAAATRPQRTQPSVELDRADATGRGELLEPAAAARSPSAGARGARPRRVRWSARTATTCAADTRPLPAKGYASHGESWSFALALRLASLRAAARRRATSRC